MTFDSSIILSSLQQEIAIFSNDQADATEKLTAVLASALGQVCTSHHLSDYHDVEHSPLILIDCHCYTPNRIQNWLTIQNPDRLPPVALYNTLPGSLHEGLLDWPCVRGFFYQHTDIQLITDGMRLLLEGDFWVPRRLLHSYLERNRQTPRHQIKAPQRLTRREREILSLLEKGATNAAMAEALSLTEHTIKTHLYNTYRKINVANRVEAINWSRQNLAAYLLE